MSSTTIDTLRDLANRLEALDSIIKRNRTDTLRVSVSTIQPEDDQVYGERSVTINMDDVGPVLELMRASLVKQHGEAHAAAEEEMRELQAFLRPQGG